MTVLRRVWLPVLGMLAVLSAAAFADIRPLVGTYSKLKVKRAEALNKIARREDVNVDRLASINHVRRGKARSGQTLTLPTLHIPPRQPQEGIVLNIPERNVYLFRKGQVKAVYPAAVGSSAWQTETGQFSLASKEMNPIWKPTKEMVAREEIKDDPVPPGKDNPVGDRWMGWSKKGYGFHSTNAPDSVGKAVTHGCVRLYPESAHKMFDLVRAGETIYSVYEPIVVGKRNNSYFISVFPDIYHRNLVSIGRAQSILKKEGLLSRVKTAELARIVHRQAGIPEPLPLRPQAKPKPAQHKSVKGKAPAKQVNPGKPRHNVEKPKVKTASKPNPKSENAAGAQAAGGSASWSTVVKPGAPAQSRAGTLSVLPPGLRQADIAILRAQWTLLLSRFRSGQVKLVNEQRDLVQLEQLSAQGFLQGKDNRPIVVDRRLGQALARLANHTTCVKPLVLLSIYRARNPGRPNEPHSNGLAADISAFGGHGIDNRRPSEAVAGVLQVLQTLPTGKYRLGLPKPPDSDPAAFLPPPPRVPNWPFFPAPVPEVGQIGAMTLTLPKTVGKSPVLDDAKRFQPSVLRWANERSAPLSDIGDPKVRRAMARSAHNGVEIVLAFPDAADHLHLDVVPEKSTSSQSAD